METELEKCPKCEKKLFLAVMFVDGEPNRCQICACGFLNKLLTRTFDDEAGRVQSPASKNKIVL